MFLGYENFCVGCPQGCINCGRNRNVPIWECDECEEEIQSEEELHEYNGLDLCKKCYEMKKEEE